MPVIPVGIMTLVGGLLAIFGGRALRRANSAREWPRVDGEVVASHVRESKGSKGQVMYQAVVKYAYAVSGKSFASERVRFGAAVSTSWRSPADRTVAAYPQGRPCRVYYDADDPAQACLEPGAGVIHYVVTGLGYLLALVGTILLLN